MNKKYSIIVLIAFLIVPFIVPQGCAENSTNATLTQELRLIEFETTTEITLKNETLPENPMNPGQTKKDIEATIQFKFERPWYFPKFLLGTKIGKWVIFRDGNYDMSVNISLSVAEKPEWCDVELPKQVTIEDIGTEFKEALIKFNVTVNETVLAFQEDDIKIQATFTPEDAWGLKPSDSKDNFTIISNYIPKIEARFNISENTKTIKLKRGKTTTLPLIITNMGNGPTIVQIEPSNVDFDWNVTIEQNNVTLEIGQSKIVNINVTVSSDRDGESQNLSFWLTPRSSEDQTIVGKPIKVTSVVLSKEFKNWWEDIIPYIIYIVILVIIAIIVIWIILRKMNR